MAIAKLLHEGESIKQLKAVIRYNTVAKEYLNSPDNPRLLQALSNMGIIDISDPVAYKDFMREFINEITLNKNQSTNKLQTKLYAHEMISFEDEDNARFNQEELAQISVELLSYLYDMENTPYLIYPQRDNGRLHYHFIRGQHNSNGTYQRVKNSKRKMRVACEKIERKYNLTLTGNNVSNAIRPANDPMAKVMKNRKLEAEYQHQKNLSEAKEQDTPLTKIKRKSYDLLMEDSYQSEAEIAKQIAYQQVEQNLAEKTQVNKKIETVKKSIFNLYKSANDEMDFIKQIEKQGISIELLRHTKSGKNKGIVFHHQGESISGGKISSSMTLGRIKKRFPNFIHTLEKPPSLHETHKLKRKMLDFQIAQINKYYKQRKNNANDDILIYFGKKNVEARPYNYNLKLSSTRDSIRFGPSTPNDHDLTLSINIAIENGWKGATLSNSSPAFLKRMMKVAYKKDPALLFFVESDKPHQLTYQDLTDIKEQLCFEDIKIALKNKLLSEDEIDKAINALRELAVKESERAFLNAIDRGFSVKELSKKTETELLTFSRYGSFKEHHNAHLKTREGIIHEHKQNRLAQLKEILSETAMNDVDTPSNSAKALKHKCPLKI
ncbi:relaxase/mobilization nuclease domain-containing protein [Vibrio algicola]|uniref:relaxase/mobilization nuclease domain-containing protein n=1 Tax=Vibrio algicola TaxID=2662262 RepID=UPI001C4A4528|nr:relaxase/mobilization nuclease domain-containing protein [Vibrio algicola]